MNAVGEIFAGVEPVLMDQAVIDRFADLHQEVDIETPARNLRLHDTEYKMVCAEGIQIEQEQLPPDLCARVVVGTLNASGD